MAQLFALIWLKWRLFRNAMRSRKALVNRFARTLSILIVSGIALLSALGLGVIAYTYTLREAQPTRFEGPEMAADFFFFMLFALIYLAWALVPLSMGGGSQFDPGYLLLYPISLRKLFVIDLLSELTSTSSIYAVPIVLAIAIGAGLGSGNLLLALAVGVSAVAVGVALAKWLAVSLGALMRKRRTRGETVLALLGAVVGLAGAFMGQLAETIMRHGASLRALRWTPPGAIALALTNGLRQDGVQDYLFALATLLAYIAVFVFLTYWIARRAALGAGGARRATARAQAKKELEGYAGWQLPVLGPGLSAVVEKELKYAARNAQLRMMALMPLILIAIRMAQNSSFARKGSSASSTSQSGFLAVYGEGLAAAGGLLYVFLLLSSLGFNLFAYEGAGMRALVLSPLERRTLLLGKNLVLTLLALLLAALLFIANQLVFRDLSLQSLLFAAFCFPLFAATFALIGNWFSLRFPKRLRFGKKMNATGVAGLLLIPVMIGMALPPLFAVAAGYLAQSLAVKYATLLGLAAASVALYFWLIGAQGRALEEREIGILEAVSGQTED
jgi:hypothetical protein